MVILLLFHTLVFISCAVYVIITCIYGGEWGSLSAPKEYNPPLDMPDAVFYKGLNEKQLLRAMKLVTPMRKKIEVHAGKDLTLQGVNRVLKKWRDLQIPSKFRLTITWSPEEERLTPERIENEMLDGLEWIHGADHLMAPMNTSPRGMLEHTRLMKNYNKAKEDKGHQDRLLDSKNAELDHVNNDDKEGLLREIINVKDLLQEYNMHIRNYENQTQNFMPIYELCYDGAGPRDDDIHFAFITYRYMPLEWQTMYDLHLNGTLVNDIDTEIQPIDVTEKYDYTKDEQTVFEKDRKEAGEADRKPAGGGGDGETTNGGDGGGGTEADGGGGGTEAGGADTVTGPLLPGGGGGGGGGGTTADGGGGGTTADGGATTTVGGAGGGADVPVSMMKSQKSDVKSLVVTKKSEAKMARRNIITILAL